MGKEERIQGEPSEAFLRAAVVAQWLTKRSIIVYLVFMVLGAALLPAVNPPWLPFVTGFMVGWWVLWVSRRMVARARAYLGLDEAPRPGRARR